MEIEINTRFLDEGNIAKFEKIKGKVNDCYRRALTTSQINFSKSDYLPRLYIIPFVRKVVLKDRHIYVFNEILEDPLDKRYYAIFPSQSFLEIIEPKFITAILAHELAHIIDYMKFPNRVKELWKEYNGNAGLVHQELDQTIAVTYYPLFKEPVRTWLNELDEKSNKDAILDRIIKSKAEIREFKGIFEFSHYLSL